jgi:hypothetical protein
VVLVVEVVEVRSVEEVVPLGATHLVVVVLEQVSLVITQLTNKHSEHLTMVTDM